LKLKEKCTFPTGTTGLMWWSNGYGMDVMETAWDDVEMTKKGAGSCPE